MSVRFENCNPFEIHVPGKRGCLVLFRPGEYSTDEWFSRFVGRGKLTCVGIGAGGVPVGSRHAQEKMKPEPKVAPRVSRKPQVALVLEEETRDYVKKSGIYFCKHCDLFRTGSYRAFQIHLGEYHQIGGVKIQPRVIEKVSEEETVVRTSTEQVQKVSEEETVIVSGTPKPDSETSGVSPIPGPSVSKPETENGGSGVGESGYTCEICSKHFSSAKGLTIHKSRNH